MMETPLRLSSTHKPQLNELLHLLRAHRSVIVVLGFASGLINILYLTGSFYMLEVYDRVLPSRSVPTLLGLSILALALYLFQGLLDLLRGRILIRVGRWLGHRLSVRVYHTIEHLALSTRNRGDGLQPIRDLDQVRSFLSGPGPLAFLDLPWIPFYIAICFLFHVWIGTAALLGAILLIVLTLLTEVFTQEPTKAAVGYAMRRQVLADAARRNAEAVHAMGMGPRLAGTWNEVNDNYLELQQRASDVAGGFGAAAKVMRMALQSGILGIGAYLVIHQQATAGIIIAGSIVGARALAPVDFAIAHWKSFVAFRLSWRRLNDLLRSSPSPPEQMALPRPTSLFSVEGVSVVPPGESRLVVQDATFRLTSGNGLGIIGPSASGKSSLVRVLVGAWCPSGGTIRLDGASLDQWSPSVLGQHLGYLPQDVELLAGTIGQNIARFEPALDPEKVIAAAKNAGIHELILRLPNGYETDVGESGTALSAGQRQRIALARALYGDPFLVVLDEPNSNLDSEGDEALSKAILGVRSRGGIVIVVAHRPSALAGTDLLMVMAQGKIQSFGPKEEVLSKMLRRASVMPPAPVRMVSEPGGGL